MFQVERHAKEKTYNTVSQYSKVNSHTAPQGCPGVAVPPSF